MRYNIPYPKQAPWFIYGPYHAPNGKWLAGYVCKSGQLDLDTTKQFDTEAECIAYHKSVDYGLAHSNATE